MELTAAEIAQRVGGELVGDGARIVRGAQSIEPAGQHDLTFAGDVANLKKLASSQAGVALVPKPADLRLLEALSCTTVLCDNPQAAFMLLLGQFRTERPRRFIGVSADARVSPSARIGANTNVYPGALVDDDVVIGENCDIHPGVVIGPGCRIGDRTVLYPNAVLYRDVQVGDRVTVHSCAVIGGDGFGYRQIDGRHEKLAHYGIVRIEDDVEIGACTTIDRAMIGETVIGAGTKLDNLVMIAHNCRLGRHNLLVGQVGFAGSVTTGDYVVCAGQVGVADHVHLGAGCTLGSKSGAPKDIPAGETWIGQPAQPVAEAMKVVMSQKKLPEIRKTLKRLEEEVARLTAHFDEPGERAAA